jgi:hypothetical protein
MRACAVDLNTATAGGVQALVKGHAETIYAETLPLVLRHTVFFSHNSVEPHAMPSQLQAQLTLPSEHRRTPNTGQRSIFYLAFSQQ